MILDIIAGIISGILGAMGFGGGGILILYLTLYKDMPQVVSQGINLLFFIPSAGFNDFPFPKNGAAQIPLTLSLSGFCSMYAMAYWSSISL